MFRWHAFFQWCKLMATQSVEEYLEAIYRLEEEATPVATSRLAERLGISPASVSEMVKKLAQRGLVTYQPYKGATLTPEGRKKALSLVRRHRLWERFLTDILGMDWHLVHEEACRLEHAASDEVVERVAKVLDRSETCPHGRPVPSQTGETAAEVVRPLTELEPGKEALVQYVADEGEDFLRYLGELGLVPEAVVVLEEKAPFEGPITIQVEGRPKVVGRKVASLVMVRPS